MEIATDKVDSEVPSPVSGIITKILCQVDEVVAIGQAVAIISTSQSESTPLPKKEEEMVAPEPKQSTAEASAIKQEQPQKAPIVPPKTSAMPLSRKSLTDQIPSNVGGRFYSPLVRNIARAEGISVEELNQLKGSGADGRVTKFDLLNYLDLKKLESTSSVKRAETTIGKPCLLYTSPSPRDQRGSRMPSSA